MTSEATTDRPTKFNHVGSPACLLLDQGCIAVARAFPDGDIYQVGSSLQRPDWRDIDVRLMLPDEQFHALFGHPDRAALNGHWSLLCAGVSAMLAKISGLPVDFQIQDTSNANHRYGDGTRVPIGMWLDRRPAPTTAPVTVRRRKPPTDTDHRHGTAPNHPKETT